MNKLKTIAAMAVIFVLVFALNAVALGWGNQAWFDLTYSFERAIVFTPKGTVATGPCDSWQEFEGSDVVQVVIDGVTYLTHYSNVCLIDE